MAENFDIQVHGFPLMKARIRALSDRTDRWGKETAEMAARAGGNAMKKAAPYSRREDFPADAKVAPGSRRDYSRVPHLRDRIGYQTRARYRPGGAGGGGSWQARFGVGDANIRPLDHDPAFILMRGTGERGRSRMGAGGGSGNMIFGSSGPMTFMHDGRQVWARRTRGIRGNRRWIDAGRGAARGVVLRRLQSLDRDLR